MQTELGVQKGYPGE